MSEHKKKLKFTCNIPQNGRALCVCCIQQKDRSPPREPSFLDRGGKTEPKSEWVVSYSCTPSPPGERCSPACQVAAQECWSHGLESLPLQPQSFRPRSSGWGWQKGGHGSRGLGGPGDMWRKGMERPQSHLRGVRRVGTWQKYVSHPTQIFRAPPQRQSLL